MRENRAMAGKPYLIQNFCIMVVFLVVLKVWFRKTHWLATSVSSRFLWAKFLSIRNDVYTLVYSLIVVAKKIMYHLIEHLLVPDTLFSIL